MTTEFSRKVLERCSVIAEIVQNMQPMYSALTTSEYQRHHIETIIGAGIWYIPNKRLWTGNISFMAISSYHPESGAIKLKLTEDHQFPRKVAARILLKTDWSHFLNPPEEMTKMYVEKFGTYNLVTPKENRDLMKFQKVEVFSTPEEAYKEAGIKLVHISEDQLQQVKQRNGEIIEEILSSIQ